MARTSVRFRLHAPPARALELSHSVALDRGWDIVSMAAGKLIARQPARFISGPVTITVETSPSDNETDVQVTGTVFGWGKNSLVCEATVEGLQKTLVDEDERDARNHT